MQKIILPIRVDYLGFCRLVFFIFFLDSCGQVSYLFKQGIGQIKIQTKAIDNEIILQNAKIAPIVKDKIRKIEKYKEFFYHYFSIKPKGIYSKTTLLETDAVSYLLIVSAKDEIKTYNFSFPIVGSFPYIGFFQKEDAIRKSEEFKQKNYHTYIRSVYAYSTLGYLEDPILSSFFVFDDFELAELIFHELFHTIFFIKDHVELNENLANYFSFELVKEYFNLSQVKVEEIERKQRIMQNLSNYIAETSTQLSKNYTLAFENNRSADEILTEFLREKFYPSIKKFCKDNDIKKDYCFPLKGEWNNARFAAFNTYESLHNKIVDYHAKLGISLFEFYQHLEQKGIRNEAFLFD